MQSIVAWLQLGPIIFGGVEGIISHMRQHHLLAAQKTCQRCGVNMRERPRDDVSDKFCWWCPQCKTRKSIRDGSFFAKSRIPLMKWMLILFYWVREYPVTDLADVAGLDPKTAVDVYQWLREVCKTALLETPIVLGRGGGQCSGANRLEPLSAQAQGKQI